MQIFIKIYKPPVNINEVGSEEFTVPLEAKEYIRKNWEEDAVVDVKFGDDPEKDWHSYEGVDAKDEAIGFITQMVSEGK